MKSLRHLAIFIFLAHNALAGWHTNEPYVAWPATNHLRWMTNVVTATNASVWTNAAYGAWTSNYVMARGYWTDDPYDDWGSPQFSPIYFENWWGDVSAVQTTLLYQAKDTRMLDCTMALMERHVMLGGTPSNFWQSLDEQAYPQYPALATHFPSLYRSEVWNLAMLRLYTRDIIPNFYVKVSTNPLAYEQLTVSSLCVRASVPTNFLDIPYGGGDSWAYTSYWRTASGSWTPYGNIVTSRWIQSCSGSNVCTNITVDSFGGAVTNIGTNGQVFTKIVTNMNVLAGYRAEDYNWDALKRCITNLVMTSIPMSWTNNGLTNHLIGWSNPDNMTNSWGYNAPPFYDLDYIRAASNAQREAMLDCATLSHFGEPAVNDRPHEITYPSLVAQWQGNPWNTAFGHQDVVRSYPVAVAAYTGLTYTAEITAMIGAFQVGVFTVQNTFEPYSIGSIATQESTTVIVFSQTNQCGIVMPTNTFPEAFPTNGLSPYMTDVGGVSGTSSNSIYDAGTYGWQAITSKAYAVWDFDYK